MLRGMDFQQLLLLIPVLLLSLTIHELSHGYVAFLLGDRTAKNMGRLTLNPIAHIDWIGFLMLMTVGFGWAKPVPVDMRYFKDPKRGMALTALAGPVANIIMAFISAFILVFLDNKFGRGLNTYVVSILYLMVEYNCVLAMFNFIPIPPLDGSKILAAFLPNRAYFMLMQYESYGMIVLMILLYTNILNPILNTGVNNLKTAIISIIQLIPM